MDDKELDNLFGNLSESDKEALKEENRVARKMAAEKKKSGSKTADKNKEKESSKPDKNADKQAENKKPDIQEETDKKEPEIKAKKDDSKDSDDDKKTKDGEDSEVKKKPDETKPDDEPGDVTEEKSEDKSEEDKKDEKETVEDSEDKDKKTDGESALKDEKDVRKPAPRPKTKREPARQQPQSLRDSIPLSGKSVFAIVLALAVVVMVILVMFLPAFRVRNVSVEGNVALSDQEILAAAGLEYDAHLMSGVSGNIFDILKLDYGKTEERIMKENPYIEDIRITIKLPSTVEIKVRERSKICYIRTPDGYAALDKDGIVLELSSFDSGKDVRPVICGLDVKYAELGKPVRIDNFNDYKKAIVVLGAIIAADNASVGGDYSMFEHTSEVRILPSGYIFLTIYSPSGKLIQIKLNSTDSIGDDMAWLLYAFNADAFDRVTVSGALDMTNDEYIFNEYT